MADTDPDRLREMLSGVAAIQQVTLKMLCDSGALRLDDLVAELRRHVLADDGQRLVIEALIAALTGSGGARFPV